MFAEFSSKMTININKQKTRLEGWMVFGQVDGIRYSNTVVVQHIATDITADTTDNDNNLPIYMISFYVHLKLQYEQIPCLAIDD